MSYNILIISNPAEPQRQLEEALRHKLGFRTFALDIARQNMDMVFSASPPDLILMDQLASTPRMIQLIRDVKGLKMQAPLILLLRYGDEEEAAPLFEAGADDFLVKPIGLERLKRSLLSAIRIRHLTHSVAFMERRDRGRVNFGHVLGRSQGIKTALALADMAAAAPGPVWIDGEPGVGKTLLARAIHGSGAWAGRPFVTADCEHLFMAGVEARLSGQDRPEHPRFIAEKIGEALGGTLYFHEIAQLAPTLQQALLEALRDGGADVRIVCGNSRNIEQSVQNGHFNAALYRALKGVAITMPPLRERKEDIAALAHHFLSVYATLENNLPLHLTEDALPALEAQDWPGNVRQLSNFLWRVALLCRNGQVDAGTLRLLREFEPAHYPMAQGVMGLASVFFDMQGQMKNLKSIEEEAIRIAIRHADGCITKAARHLGIGRSTLYRKIDGWNISATPSGQPR